MSSKRIAKQPLGKRSRKKQPQKSLSPELQRQIDQCASSQELLDLLFSLTDIKHEDVIDEIDRKLNELDPPC